MGVKVKATLVQRQSKKTGNNYTALELEFENGYKKLVFLDNAETYMFLNMSTQG